MEDPQICILGREGKVFKEVTSWFQKGFKMSKEHIQYEKGIMQQRNLFWHFYGMKQELQKLHTAKSLKISKKFLAK